MSIKDIFGRFWNKNDTIYNCYSDKAASEIFYKELAINSAINIIAKTISNAEFRTFKNKKEIKEHNYYLFNVEPNQNQNATEFNQELIRKLIYDNEVLVIQENGMFYIANTGGYTINDRTLYQTFFTNVSVGDLNFNKTYYMEDVFYLKLNNSKIKKLIDNVYSSYGVLISQCIDDYKKSKGIRGKVKITTAWAQRIGDQEKLQKIIQQKFRSYFSSDNSVIPMEERI
jgi:HK97 family phage portal protein